MMGRKNQIGEILKSLEARIGLVVLCVFLIFAVFAPFIAPYDPYDVTQRSFPLIAPCRDHLLGTDGFGVDILSQIIYGSRVSLSIGILTAAGVTILGALVGALAAGFGGVTDLVVTRIIDFVMVLPGLPIMIMILTYVGSSFWVLAFIMIIFGWAGVSRIARSIMLSEKTREYISAAKASGASKWYIVFKHLLPSAYPVLFVNASLTAAGSILAEAGLSFLGFGDPKMISWGKMLNFARTYNAILLGAWWWIVFPGLAVFLTAFSIMSLGIAVERVVNPRLKERED